MSDSLVCTNCKKEIPYRPGMNLCPFCGVQISGLVSSLSSTHTLSKQPNDKATPNGKSTLDSSTQVGASTTGGNDSNEDNKGQATSQNQTLGKEDNIGETYYECPEAPQQPTPKTGSANESGNQVKITSLSNAKFYYSFAENFWTSQQ